MNIPYPIKRSLNSIQIIIETKLRFQQQHKQSKLHKIPPTNHQNIYNKTRLNKQTKKKEKKRQNGFENYHNKKPNQINYDSLSEKYPRTELSRKTPG